MLLVSDGGTTLSSINNPSLNINNANDPINSVPLPATTLLFAFGAAGFLRRKNSHLLTLKLRPITSYWP